MQENIRANHVAFRDAFLAEVLPSDIDTSYGAVLRVILYYLWRGCSISLDAGLKGKTDPKASLIAQSAYKAIFAIVQLLRAGYYVDAAILLRALMERIAIVGYLGENRDLISRYFNGEISLYKKALPWAKKRGLPNWMILYSALSGVAHSNVVGPAGHINIRTKVAEAFRPTSKPDPRKPIGWVEEFLGLTVYALLALDPLALGLIQNTSVTPFSNDPGIAQSVGNKDTAEFIEFLQTLVNRYSGKPN